MTKCLPRRVTKAVAGLLLATAFCLPAKAQTVACTGPTAGNCVAVAPFSSSAGAGSGNAGYPSGATPLVITAAGNVGSGSVTATINGAAGQHTYICGFTIANNGATTPAIQNITFGTFNSQGSGNLTFLLNFAAVGTLSTLQQTFTPCLRSTNTAQNLALTVNTQAGNTLTDISLWGYQQ